MCVGGCLYKCEALGLDAAQRAAAGVFWLFETFFAEQVQALSVAALALD